MRKVNMVTLEEQYWHALSFCFDSYGFKSRQELIEKLLTSWIDEHRPEDLKKGVEKMQFMATGQKVAGRRLETIPMVLVKSKTRVYNAVSNKIRYFYRDGRVLEAVAAGPLDGFQILEKDHSNKLTFRDMDEKVKNFEFLEEVEQVDPLKAIKDALNAKKNAE